MLAENGHDPLPAVAYQIIVDVEGAIRFDQQPRNDRVEYGKPAPVCRVDMRLAVVGIARKNIAVRTDANGGLP